jgi:hypothetical protein
VTTTLDEYNGGNCASESTPWVPISEPWALPMEMLRVIASEVATNTASDYDLTPEQVHEDATLLPVCGNRSSGGDDQPLPHVESDPPRLGRSE